MIYSMHLTGHLLSLFQLLSVIIGKLNLRAGLSTFNLYFSCDCPAQVQKTCLQTNNSNNLPLLLNYPRSTSRIHHGHQAIIPSYELNCCGNITEWGVDLNPDRALASSSFYFIFQVWRPSPHNNMSTCYKLVDDFISTGFIGTDVAIVTPSTSDQLQFQPGDVLGFYVESRSGSSDADNGVVVLNNGSNRNEVVWHASIDITAQTSLSGSCPYPVGTNGVLNALTRAAPVISISITTYACYGSMSLIPSALVNTLSATSPQQTPIISAPTTHNSGSLVAGAVVTIIIVIVIVIITVTLVIVITVKRHNAVKKQLNSTTANSLALANQVYGKL